jgi:hypothetical protein
VRRACSIRALLLTTADIFPLPNVDRRMRFVLLQESTLAGEEGLDPSSAFVHMAVKNRNSTGGGAPSPQQAQAVSSRTLSSPTHHVSTYLYHYIQLFYNKSSFYTTPTLHVTPVFSFSFLLFNVTRSPSPSKPPNKLRNHAL